MLGPSVADYDVSLQKLWLDWTSDRSSLLGKFVFNIAVRSAYGLTFEFRSLVAVHWQSGRRRHCTTYHYKGNLVGEKGASAKTRLVGDTSLAASL